MSKTRSVKHEAQSTLDTCKMTGGKLACFVAHAALWEGFLTHKVSQVGDIDAHGTRRGTQAIAGAGLVALIAVLLDKGRQALGVAACLAQVGYLTLNDDALA